MVKPATPTSRNIGAPPTKYITPHAKSTRQAWPKSGWSASSRHTVAAKIAEYIRPGGPPRSCAEAISHAATTINPGLRNSDGWTEKPPSDSQRTAPLPKSVPMNGSAMMMANVTPKPSVARRRTSLGDIIEVMNMVIIASIPNWACLIT